jgi:4-oxalocrotonate tautomerase
MPYVKIEMLSGRTKEQKAKLVKDVTEALQRNCAAKPESTHIVIQDVDKENWASGGVLLSDK